MALLTGPEKGVHFFGEYISLKNGTFCPLFNHDTTSFKDTCLSIYSIVLPSGLYVLNGQPHMPASNLFRPLTVEIGETRKKLRSTVITVEYFEILRLG
jgi:hypothetical protein